MAIEFIQAKIPDDLEALLDFDRRIFHQYPADLFPPETWAELDTWWMVVDGQRVGCSAFLHHSAGVESIERGSLYIMTTGVLPEFQGRGYGVAQKKWQIGYARKEGFRAIVTNSRLSNTRMIALNRKFGFEPVGLIEDYYAEPREAAITMALRLKSTGKG